jgi:hypothetical protein
MKKFAVIMVLGLALLLTGLVLSASATDPVAGAPLILDPTNITLSTVVGAPAPYNVLKRELHLNEVVDILTGNFFADSQTFANSLVPGGILQTLTVPDVYNGNPGTWSYTLNGFYYTGAGWTQNPGTNAAGVPLPVSFPGIGPVSGNKVFTIVGGVPISPATTGGLFGFADQINASAFYLYTELNQNNPLGVQSNGLIFKISDTQFIVAFEDGGGGAYDSQNLKGLLPLGDVDYNDLVLNVSRTFTNVPLPPTAFLLGSGLVALVGLRRWRKKV